MRRTHSQLTDVGVNLRTVGLFTLLIAAALVVTGSSAATWVGIAGAVTVTLGASMRQPTEHLPPE